MNTTKTTEERCECGAKVNTLGRDIAGGLHPGKACHHYAHTAGPWEASSRAFGNCDCGAKISVWSKNGLIATAATIHEGAVNAEANAAFIALAPDLLMVVAALHAWNNNPNENGIGLERICRAAKKVLAKVAPTPS